MYNIGIFILFTILIFSSSLYAKELQKVSHQFQWLDKTHELHDDEIEYLKNKKNIKVCTNPNWRPIEFTQNSKPQGISIDILNIVVKKLELKIDFIKTNSWKQSQEYLKDKKCDILPAAIKTTKREKYASFSKPYLSYTLAIITKNDKPFVTELESVIDETMSRKKGSGLISKLKRLYPDIKIEETKSFKEAFQAVQNDKVYFTIATLPILAYFKGKYGLDNLQVAGYTKMKYNLSIAVRKDDKVLLNAINKVLINISSETLHVVNDKWSSQTVIKRVDHTMVWQVVGVFTCLLSIVVFFLIRQNRLTERIEQQKNELELLNKNLELRIKEEVEKNRQKDQQILHQSKLAQMGEMISMIAHQWRQPLAAISATINNLIFQILMDEYDKEEFELELNLISNYSQHLSKTIDDFRDFFKSGKNKEVAYLQKIIEDTLKIIQPSIENKNIRLITELNCNELLNTYPNEIKQVILNLLKNAEDILLEREIKTPIIKITTDKIEVDSKKEGIIIQIIDNAGGVPKDIINKIFEPYFSTKLEKEGTGLGLYMSKTIIEEHCNGKLTVFNTQDGAVFKIEFNQEIIESDVVEFAINI